MHIAVLLQQRLSLAERNRETLETIEKSLFVAVLDEGSPKVGGPHVVILKLCKKIYLKFTAPRTCRVMSHAVVTMTVGCSDG